MMSAAASVDLAPLAQLALAGLTVALLPLGWWWLRHRGAQPGERLRALTLLTLFFTFDLVLFGAFTRLTDSGLGCPDWPGCYGHASPVGAQAQIQSAQSVMPTGPVTHGKAWIEMVHRYLAMSVGLLIIALVVGNWMLPRRALALGEASDARASPWWATATLGWVCLQGAFGAWTVTMKLYPAVVTAHLLGGIGLMVLLAAQSQVGVSQRLPLSRTLRAAVAVLALLCVAQVTLGAWVSTNYAVLACSDFPTCQGQWWPSMDFSDAFTVLRPLGIGRDGHPIAFEALTAIHMVHRIGAAVVFAGIALLVARLWVSRDRRLRRWALALAAAIVWQIATGLGNVMLGWPLLAAVAHTGGAAVLVTLLTVMLMRARQASPARASVAAAPTMGAVAS